MSLMISTTFDTGLSAASAVHKISEAQFIGPTTVKVVLAVYADFGKSQNHSVPCIERRFFEMPGFDPSTDENLHTQVYTWLKTLPEYSGAVDC